MECKNDRNGKIKSVGLKSKDPHYSDHDENQSAYVQKSLKYFCSTSLPISFLSKMK